MLAIRDSPHCLLSGRGGKQRASLEGAIISTWSESPCQARGKSNGAEEARHARASLVLPEAALQKAPGDPLHLPAATGRDGRNETDTGMPPKINVPRLRREGRRQRASLEGALGSAHTPRSSQSTRGATGRNEEDARVVSRARQPRTYDPSNFTSRAVLGPGAQWETTLPSSPIVEWGIIQQARQEHRKLAEAARSE